MPSRTTAPLTGQDREVIRLVTPVVLWWVWVVFVVANVADFAIQGLSSARFGAVVCAVLLFVTGLMYTLALRPRVVTDTAGLTVVNPYRAHRVPWPLVQSVDTADWVRVQYGLPVADTGGRPTRTVYCWALYISSRAKRKISRGPRPQRRGAFGGGLFGRSPVAASRFDVDPAEHSRLPDEARNLASMPVAQAIAARLDARAARERARRPAGGPDPRQEQATASWNVPALAAVVIPALVLLVVALI
jgi:Bacterial PH domain